MSYYLEVIKDSPDVILMLNGNILDSSGNGRVTVPAGTIVDYHPPLVQSGTKAAVFGPAITVGFPTRAAAPNTEFMPFSLEAWFFGAPGISARIASHASEVDGLYWDGTSIHFRMKFTSGLTGISYRPETPRAMHVVGVFNGTALEIHVNGEVRASMELTDTQLADTITLTTPNGMMYAGSGALAIQGVAVYYRALSGLQIKNHFDAGRFAPTYNTASSQGLAITERVHLGSADLFINQRYDVKEEWLNSKYTCNVTDKIFSRTDDANEYIEGTWTTAIQLDSGTTSINGVRVDYEGQGAFTLESSLDESTWVPVVQGAKIAALPAGTDPNGVTLYLRATFIAGQYGEITAIEIIGYRTMNPTPSQRVITVSQTSAVLNDDQHILTYDTNNGVNLGNSTLTFLPTADNDSVFSLGYWYYAISGTVTSNVTTSAFYENGVARAERTILGRWTYTVRTFAENTTQISITGNAIIVAPTLYGDTLTADNVSRMYQTFTGYTQIPVEAPDPLTFSTPSATIYANDWSITGAG